MLGWDPVKRSFSEASPTRADLSRRARHGRSYKRAWLLLDSMNQAFTEPVVTATPRGTGGGGATLTPLDAEVLERYRRIHDRAAATAEDDMAGLGWRARPDASQKI